MLKYNDYIDERMTPRLTCSMYIQDQYRGGSRGGGVHHPGSAPAIGHFTVVGLVSSGCKESQFYSLPFGQAVASMY